ncbi:MAG TPA: cupredoxin domain-containing protein [Nocardioidaceae bacterium]|nr:cupredoxin domain-containing protein [Nocardioidaceae bacterium]
MTDTPRAHRRTPWRRAGRLLAGSGLLLAILFGTSGCIIKPGISPKAHEVHDLFWIIAYLAAPVFLFVEGMLLVCVIWFRHKRKKGEVDDWDAAEPVQDYGNNYALGAFFVGPLVIVIIGLVFGETIVGHVDEVDATPAENLVVTGFQWEWQAQYTKENFTVTGKTLKKYMTMELPVNKPATITLKSKDVIHEFYVPALLYMKNAVPGHPNKFTIKPTKLGTYPSQCAQYCGLYHSRMKFTLKVVTQKQFDSWVSTTKQAAAKQTEQAASACTVQGDDISITAHNISWDKKCLAVEQDKPFDLTIINKDAGVAHNFAIYTSSDLKKAKRLYLSPDVTGTAAGAKKTFTGPALKPGTYYFQCDIHGPAMSGTLKVGPEPKGTDEGGEENGNDEGGGS